ncbi:MULTISPECIES: hypothetical protein [unclassified Caballeronia]|uniref:hypothetical protein n=1 Tax=unclassified Caballeronia TaxID=2646786 RepID=UPI00286405C5|nr:MULTISPECIES: hypothetical protein [unclassified Caballeronia]MDR5777650.1 hypothetical protein [Caballeronia sp. LZ002]MDR5853088.1 hypothetical protein [Caballeronia sp. LZ003]
MAGTDCAEADAVITAVAAMNASFENLIIFFFLNEVLERQLPFTARAIFALERNLIGQEKSRHRIRFMTVAKFLRT